MTESDKKINWLAVLSILLALLLVVQTGIFLHLFNQKAATAKKEAAESVHFKTIPPTSYSDAHTPASSAPRRQSMRAATYQDPWSTFDQMQEDMSRMMGGFMAGLPSMMTQMNQHMGIDSMPSVDMEEKNNAYIVHADIPGLDKDKIEITVRGEILTIHGIRETSTQEENGSFYTQERSYGSFSRSLRLPGPVDEANVKADYQNGVLIITLPKLNEEQASKKISVS